MRTQVVRRLRRLVGAGDQSPRQCRHYRHPQTGVCVADDLRRRYQAVKKFYRGLPWNQKTT
jgi:hypothetical protein